MRYGRGAEHVGGTGRAEVNSTYRQGGPGCQMESSFSKPWSMDGTEFFHVQLAHTDIERTGQVIANPWREQKILWFCLKVCLKSAQI